MVSERTIKVLKKISREKCLDLDIRTRVEPKNVKKTYSRKEKHKKSLE
jgi:hypothetical protein